MSDFDFSNVSVEDNNNFLEPGHYNVNISSAVFTDMANQGKNSYLDVTFATKEGSSIRERYYVTTAAMQRLQYLYANWIGEPLAKAFKDSTQVGTYFEKVFTADKCKAIRKNIIVGAKEVGEKVYSTIPFKGYILPDDMKCNYGPFETEEMYQRYLVKDKNVSKTTNNVIINDAPPSSNDNNTIDDLPF